MGTHLLRPGRTTRLGAAVLLGLALLALVPVPSSAQDAGLRCEAFEGITCDGWFTDVAGVVGDDAVVENAIDRVVGRYGVEIAIVIVDDTAGRSTADFAFDLGTAWGVGDAQRDDGVVIVVNLSERRIELVAGPGLPTFDYSRVTGAATSFYAAGDFQSGTLAVVGSLEQELLDIFEPGEPPGDPGVEPDPPEVVVPEPRTEPNAGTRAVGFVIVGVMLLGGGALLVRRRRDQDDATRARRARMIDDVVARLDPAADELVQLEEFRLPAPGRHPEIPTMDAVRALRSISTAEGTHDAAATTALADADLVVLIDHEALISDTRVPFELAVKDERDLLEGALQATIATAGEVSPRNPEEFTVRLGELERIVVSLRPHRIAADRERSADALASRLAATPLGPATTSDAGERLLRAAPALDGASSIQESVAELESVYAIAKAKTRRLAALYERLPENTARPAVAAALADVHRDEATAVDRYEKIRRRLQETGASLEADGLSIPAIAALLLMNNTGADLERFVSTYERHRGRGREPGESVELALAGITHKSDIDLVRREAERLGLPISLTVALLRSRDDGPEVYATIRDELASHGMKGDTRRTIAGILAVSLEPALATQRWLAAREALAALGLEGAYADVAAAFGASDPRGPRVFALAYAAQRQALARSEIRDADRFAPELAHEGTRRQRDSWSGRPIPPGLGTFDPFTLLFYHWVITRGHRGSLGWEPIYRDASWANDRDSWWGGTGGFGGFGGGIFTGGGGGGSSWGGGGWGGSGGFGGFGGGGFGGGGGGGSSW